MKEIIFEPELHYFDTCAEFAKEFNLGESDLVLTNEYIFEPFFRPLGVKVHTIFQEKYGAGEPTDVMVEAILADAGKVDYKRVVAVGGGTIIDIAKAIAVADEDNLDALYAKMPNLNKVKELVIVPTTCGTGSEVTNISVVNRTRMGTKMGLVGPAMFADYSVLIPELLTTLPLGVFATSSIDALVHAIESSLSPKATPYTKLFGYKAIEMIIKGYQKIVRDGLDTRKDHMAEFLIASNYAGLAFGTAGCGTVHAMAYPLGGKYHVAHGESNYVLLTGVLKEYMRHRTDGEIAVMNDYLAGLLGCGPAEVYDALEALLNQVLRKKPLHEFGVTQEDLPEFAKSVIQNQQRLLGNSFIPMTEELVLKIYRALF